MKKQTEKTPSEKESKEKAPLENKELGKQSRFEKELESFLAEFDETSPVMNSYLEFFSKFTRTRNSGTEVFAEESSPEMIYSYIENYPKAFSILAPIYSWSLFERKDFETLYDFTSQLDLKGHKHDQITGKLINYHYQSLKYLHRPMDEIYKLRVICKEYGKPFSLMIVNNCILDHQINNHIYDDIDLEEINHPTIEKHEKFKYFYYKGIIALVSGNYKGALEYFENACILEEKKTHRQLQRYVAVTRLLSGDYSVSYSQSRRMRMFHQLGTAIETGDSEYFHEVLEDYRESLFADGMYFLVRRLISNVRRESLLRIARCYSRIRVDDITKIVGMDANCLLCTMITDGVIQGRIEDEVFYSERYQRDEVNLNDEIESVINLRKMCVGMMKFPEIKMLSYEGIIEREALEH